MDTATSRLVTAAFVRGFTLGSPTVDGATIRAVAGEHVVVHTRDETAVSGEGWECTEERWCTFDYGLAIEDDTVEQPPSCSGSECEPSPGPTPPAPQPLKPIFIEVEPVGCGKPGDGC